MSTIVRPMSEIFRPGLLEKIAGFILGYDIFISYSREDAFYYAARLGKVLVKNGFICYLDQYHTAPGKVIPEVIDNALRRSTSLILIGTPNAVASANVSHEIKVFNEDPRNAIAIDVDDELTKNPKWDEMIPGLPKTAEAGEAVRRGRPSKQVFSRIFDSGKFTRRNEQLKRWLLILVGIIVVLLSGTAITSYKIVVNARRAEREAVDAQEKAVHQANLAQQGRVEAEYQRLVAQVDRNLANASAKEADEKRQKAEGDTSKAQALERQARQNAASAHEQELAAQSKQRVATAEQLAAHAQRVMLDKPQLSIQLGLKALKETKPEDPPVPAAWQALHDSLVNSGGTDFRGNAGGDLLSIQFSPNGHWLLVQNEDSYFVVWDTSNFDRASVERKVRVLVKSNRDCKNPRFSPSGEMVAAECQHSITTVWDLRTPEEIVQTVDTSMLPDNLISDDARWLISLKSITPDPLQLLSKLSAGRFVKPEDVSDNPYNDTLLYTGDWLILGGNDRAYLYDLKDKNPETPVKVIDWYPGHHEFSPDNRWLLTTLKDGSIQVWDLSTIKTGSTPRVLPDISGINLKSQELPPDYDKLSATEFSPDGRWLVTCDIDGEIDLFDMRVQPIPKHIHLGWVPSPTPNPTFTSDSKWLSILVPDAVAKFWSLGDEVKPEDFFGQSAGITEVHFSPNARWVCAQMKLGGMHIHHLAPDGSKSDKLASNLYLPGSNGPFTFRGFDSAGDWLSLSVRNAIQAWHLSETGEFLVNNDPFILRGHDSPIKHVAYSPDAHWLITVADDNGIRLWNLRNLQPANQPKVLYKQSDSRADFSSDHRWVFSRGPGNEAELWDLLDGNPLRGPIQFARLRDMQDPQADPVYRKGSSFSPDGRWLITGPVDKEEEERVWDLSPLQRDSSVAAPIAHKLCKVKEDVAIFSPDGRYVVAVCSDGVVRAWDMPLDNTASGSFELGTIQPTGSRFEFSPDSRWLLTIPVTGPSRIWNMRMRGTEARRPLKLERDPDPESSDWPKTDFSHDGRWLIASDDELLRLWDLNDMSQELKPVSEVPLGASEAVFSADSRWMMVDDENKILLWDLRPNKSNRRPTRYPFRDRTFGSKDLFWSPHLATFSPNGRWLILTDGGDKAVLFDLSGDGEPRRLELTGHVDNLGPFTFSPGSRWLIAGTGEPVILDKDPSKKSFGSALVLWDLESGKTDGRIVPDATLLGEPMSVRSQGLGENGVIFGPGDHWLITGAKDRGSRFWDLTSTDRLPKVAGGSSSSLTFEESCYPLECKAFSPDGRWVVGQDPKDHHLELWDLKSTDLHPLIIPAPKSSVSSFGFSSDSRFLVGTGDDSLFLYRLWPDELQKIAREIVANFTAVGADADLLRQPPEQLSTQAPTQPARKRHNTRRKHLN